MVWIKAIRTWKGRADDHAFGTLLRPHLEYLYRVAYRFCGSAEDAEDLVQELAAKLFPRLDELRAVDKLRPWLTRALYRMFVDERRRASRSPLGHLSEADTLGEEGLDALAGDAPSPEAETELLMSGERLHLALARLSADHRALLVLHDVEGYTLQELEVQLETPLGTLKSRLHRARAQLRQRLEREPFAPRERVTG